MNIHTWSGWNVEISMLIAIYKSPDRAQNDALFFDFPIFCDFSTSNMQKSVWIYILVLARILQWDESCILYQKNIAGNICQKRSRRHFLPCMMSIWFFFMLKSHVFIQKNTREGQKSSISRVFFVLRYFSKPSRRK